jgi:hypothetical protein
MLKFRSAPWDPSQDPTRSANRNSYFGSAVPARPRTFVETPRTGWPTTLGSPPEPRPFIRRQLSPESGRALEILGHAIEYLADEYAADAEHKGPLGSADPRVEAIQVLKALNRGVYYSGTEVEPAFRRMRRWLLGSRTT